MSFFGFLSLSVWSQWLTDPSSSSSQSEVKIRVHLSFLWAREKKGYASHSAGWVSNNMIYTIFWKDSGYAVFSEETLHSPTLTISWKIKIRNKTPHSQFFALRNKNAWIFGMKYIRFFYKKHFFRGRVKCSLLQT